MFQATNIRMAASAASGTFMARGAATSTMANSVSACTMPATGLVAPLLMLVTVRAIVPVAGMPPKNGATKFATPWPMSSWLGSWRSSVMPSATRAHSRDSIAPSRAMVSVGPTSCFTVSHENSGSAKPGRPCGMPPNFEPMVSTGRCSNVTASVADTSTITVPGRCAIHFFQRGPSMR